MNWNLLIDIARTSFEIGILAFLIYRGLYFLRSTRGAYVLAGIGMMTIALYALSNALDFRVIPDIMRYLLQTLAIALVVIFQPELRRAFAQLGSYVFWSGNRRRRELAGELVGALANLSRHRIGALIVLERRVGMKGLVDEGVKLDAKVNGMLLESIFYPNSALHDGAVIIRGDRIVAAKAILPLTASTEISRRLGTRHRAALGISEDTDAVALVVSEETGIISLAGHGVLLSNMEMSELEEILEKLFVLNAGAEDIFVNPAAPEYGRDARRSPDRKEEF